MKVVSENSDEDIARNRVAQEIVWPLRELTANLLRIVRGAGKPHEIEKQAADLLIAFSEYREAAGCGPAWEITDALRLDRGQEHIAWDAFADAEDMMVSGALQIAASRLVGQLTQERRGEDELHKGIGFYKQAQADARKEHDEAIAKAAAEMDDRAGKLARRKRK